MDPNIDSIQTNTGISIGSMLMQLAQYFNYVNIQEKLKDFYFYLFIFTVLGSYCR